MTNALKKISLTLLSIVLLVLLAAVLLIIFVSPNKFKPLITAQVLKHTGRQVTLDGDLSWNFYPFLGFKTGHAVLNNPAGFTNPVFAEMAGATVGVKLMPLLSGRIEMTEIVLNGLRLNLIKKSDGETNWQDLSGAKSIPVASTPVNTVPVRTRQDLHLQIPTVEVTDSAVTLVNEQTQQTVNVSHFELHAKDVDLDNAFPLRTSFEYAVENPKESGQVKADGQFRLDLHKQLYTINGLAFNLQTTGQQKMTADIHGDVIADMEQQNIHVHPFAATISGLQGVQGKLKIKGDIKGDLVLKKLLLTDFNAELANLTLNGNVTIENFATAPIATGHLKALPFDIKKFLQATGKDVPALQVAKMLTADFDFSTIATKATYAIQAINAHGNLTLGELQVSNLKAAKLVIPAQLENGVLTLSPISAALYQGTLQGQVKVNLAASEPQITLQTALANVQAEPLLADLEKQNSAMKLKGAGNINVQATTAGLTSDAIVKNLNGTANFNFKNGQLTGLNIGHMVDTAYSMLKGQSPPAAGENVTNFGDLTGTAIIQNGIITNNDLLVSGPRFTVKGQGTVNLVTQQINYSLLTTAHDVAANHNDKDALNLYSMAIPVTVSGQLDNPAVRLDVGSLVQQIAKLKMKSLQGNIQDTVKEKLSGQAGKLLSNFLGN